MVLAEQHVLVNLHARDCWDVMGKLVAALAASGELAERGELSDQEVTEAVTDRERTHSTALGHGIAFPHARLAGYSGVSMALATLAEPVDFGAADGEPVDLVCLLLIPEDQPQLALKLMARFARMVSDPINRAFLRREERAEVLAEFVTKRVLHFDSTIRARDLMRAPLVDIYPETPLREVTRAMSHFSLDAVSVVERDGTLVGEITAETLFKLGLPDFFSQLKSVGFISELDPFEKYFEYERRKLAREVMSHEFSALPEDATLLEVVFELAVKRFSKVYVVDRGRRVGVIDRILVLDRVLNL